MTTPRKSSPPVAVRAYSLVDAGNAYGLSADTVAKAVHSGALRAKRVGRVIRVDAKALDDWYSGLPDAAEDA